MASIEKRNGAWRVRWRNPGERAVHSHKCPSKSVAQAIKLEIESAYALGQPWPRAPMARAGRLAGLIEAWLIDCARLKRAPRTLDRAQAVFDRFGPWVAGRVGDEPDVSSLSRSLLEAYDLQCVEQGNGVSARRTAMWAIGSVWKWGWERDDWRQGMSMPAVPRMPMPTRRRAVAPTWEQMDAIVDAARAGVAERKDREWTRRLVTMLRGLGWRVTQLIELDWPDVDLAASEITLRPELGKSQWERAGRTVPLAPWLSAEMRTWIPRSGRVIGTSITRHRAAVAIGRLWDRTGAPEELWRQRPDHAFRAGLISGLKRARQDVEAAEYYVGHAPPEMRGIYVDPAALPLNDIANAIPAPGVPWVSGAVLSEQATR